LPDPECQSKICFFSIRFGLIRKTDVAHNFSPDCPKRRRTRFCYGRERVSRTRSGSEKSSARRPACDGSVKRAAPLLINRAAKIQSYLSKVRGGLDRSRARCLAEPGRHRSPTRFVHRLSTLKMAGRRARGRFGGRASFAARERKKTKNNGQVEDWRRLGRSLLLAPCAQRLFTAPRPRQGQPVDSWCASPQRIITSRSTSFLVPAGSCWSSNLGPKGS